MLLSSQSINKLVDIITGQRGITAPQTKEDIDESLQELGFTNLVSSYEECFKGQDDVLYNMQYDEESFKLSNYVRIKLEGINGIKDLKVFTELFIRFLTQTYRDYTVKKGEDDKLLEIFDHLNEGFERDNYKIEKIEEDNDFRLYSLDDSIISYGCYFKETKTGNFILINEHYEKCIRKINSRDYSGAITNAQSLLEQILIEIRNDINKTPNKGHKGNLPALLESVFKLLDITNNLKNPSLSGYQKIEEGFNVLSCGLQLLRYGMSDAHSISHLPTQKDALLAVNTSKTLSNFIVEHYFEKYVIGQSV
jgi:hypothetical protein